MDVLAHIQSLDMGGTEVAEIERRLSVTIGDVQARRLVIEALPHRFYSTATGRAKPAKEQREMVKHPETPHRERRHGK